MNEQVAYRQQVHDLEDAIRALVGDKEIVTHFDVTVSTRFVSDPSKGRSHRYSPPGSDPEVSLGKMMAATDRLRADLIQRRNEADGP
jgi:hypothetical protein